MTKFTKYCVIKANKERYCLQIKIKLLRNLSFSTDIKLKSPIAFLQFKRRDFRDGFTTSFKVKRKKRKTGNVASTVHCRQ